MFSKTCEYGIKATIFIAQNAILDKKVNLKDVSKAIDSPPAYTSKILQKLTKHNIISSEKGNTGGFTMDSHALDKSTLLNIVFAIDGESIYNGCGLGLTKCNAKMPCPVHHQFKTIRDELKKMLATTKVKSLALEHENGLSFLKR